VSELNVSVVAAELFPTASVLLTGIVGAPEALVHEIAVELCGVAPLIV
jgi:hypothetical protein